MAKARGNGTGSFKRLPNGKTRWAGSYIGLDGKLVRRSGTSMATGKEGLEEARRAFARFMEGKDKVVPPPPPKADRLTIPELANMWYAYQKERVEKRKLEESTYSWYSGPVNLIKTNFQGWRARGVDAKRAEDVIDNLQISTGYKRQTKSALGSMYRWAAKMRMLEPIDNPVSLMDDLRDIDERKPEKEAYTLEEMQMILRAAPLFEGNEAMYRYYCGLVVGQSRGNRGQEIFALRDTDIVETVVGHEVRVYLNITKAVKLGEHGRAYIGHTKNPGSAGRLYLPEYAWPFARWLREHAGRDTTSSCNGTVLTQEPDEAGMWLFYSARRDGPATPHTYRRWIKRIIAMIPGLRKLNPHEALRHTFTSAGTYGANIEKDKMMKLTRHETEKVFDGYAHLDDEEQVALIKKFNTAVMDSFNMP